MSRFIKIKEFIEVLRPKRTELQTLFKMNIACNLVFTGDTYTETLVIGERNFEGNKNLIEVNNNFIGYDELIEMIIEKVSMWKMSFQIPVAVFKLKEPLILLFENFNSSIIENCVFVDYFENKFIINNRPLANGAPDKLYYFEANDSVLLFSADGPKLIYGKFSSVEEIFCTA